MSSSSTTITPSTSSIQDFSTSLSDFPSLSTSSPSRTLVTVTLTPSNGNNNDDADMSAISRSSSLLFGFLITFLALFIGFMACGYSSRRAAQLRGQRGMAYAAQLSDLRYSPSRWNTPPHLWDVWVDDGRGKTRWKDMMPLSASLVHPETDEKRPSSSPRDGPDDTPPAPLRNIPPEDFSPVFVFASRAFSRMGLSIPPPPPRTPQQTSPRPSRQPSMASFVLPTSTFMIPSLSFSSSSSSRPPRTRSQQQQDPSSSSSRDPNSNPNADANAHANASLEEVTEGIGSESGNTPDQHQDQHRRRVHNVEADAHAHAQISVIIAMPNPSSTSPSIPRLSNSSSSTGTPTTNNSHTIAAITTTTITNNNNKNTNNNNFNNNNNNAAVAPQVRSEDANAYNAAGVIGGDYQIGIAKVPILGVR